MIDRDRVAERFWAKVDRSGGDDACWPWLGCRFIRTKTRQLSYGAFGLRGRTQLAHRVAYEFTFGPAEKGLVVRHSCDNAACCNPKHLSVGSQKDNIRDCVERGRRHRRCGELGDNVLSEADALAVLAAPRVHGSGKALAAMYGVSQQTICDLRKGRTWAHLREARDK